MDSGLIYANARIKSLENNLLTTDKMLRMIDSLSIDDALKVLTESNYGGGVVLDNPNKYENLLLAEMSDTTEFIKEIMPKGLGMEIFFYKHDYHNAKGIMKAKYSSQDNIKDLLTSQGLIETEKLIDNINDDEYGDLYDEMKQALEEIDATFVSGDRSPRVIDVTLDKAYFKHISRLSSKYVESIRRYIKSFADLTNIATFIRSKSANMGVKKTMDSLVEGGEISLDFYEPLYDLSSEMLQEKFKYTNYYSIVLKAFESKSRALVDYETAQDDYLLSIFKSDKHDMFSIAPMAGYYLAKVTEIKVARMILVCIKNRVDKKLIKQRLRDLYA